MVKSRSGTPAGSHTLSRDSNPRYASWPCTDMGIDNGRSLEPENYKCGKSLSSKPTSGKSTSKKTSKSTSKAITKSSIKSNTKSSHTSSKRPGIKTPVKKITGGRSKAIPTAATWRKPRTAKAPNRLIDTPVSTPAVKKATAQKKAAPKKTSTKAAATPKKAAPKKTPAKKPAAKKTLVRKAPVKKGAKPTGVKKTLAKANTKVKILY